MSSPIWRFSLSGLVYLPTCVTFLTWLLYMSITNSWHVFAEQKGWLMSVQSAVGSFVAGCSPLGGGAVAYPVMVLIIKLVSEEARAFSMMQQTFGMGCAAWRICTTTDIDYGDACKLFGLGLVGFQLGYYLLEVPGPFVQTIYFTFTFCVGVLLQIYADYLSDYLSDDRTKMVQWRLRDTCVAIPTLVLGGILFSYVGTGIDVVMYIYFRFFHNVDEVIATNYSVILAAWMSFYGFFNEGIVMNRITTRQWHYLLCVIPVVSIFAPVGNFVTNRLLSRKLLKAIIFFLETFQYAAGFAITIRRDVRLVALSLSLLSGTILSIASHAFIKRCTCTTKTRLENSAA